MTYCCYVKKFLHESIDYLMDSLIFNDRKALNENIEQDEKSTIRLEAKWENILKVADFLEKHGPSSDEDVQRAKDSVVETAKWMDQLISEIRADLRRIGKTGTPYEKQVARNFMAVHNHRLGDIKCAFGKIFKKLDAIPKRPRQSRVNPFKYDVRKANGPICHYA